MLLRAQLTAGQPRLKSSWARGVDSSTSTLSMTASQELATLAATILSSVAAFLGLSMSLKKLGVSGRVQLLGAPDKEGSGAKVKLLDAGAYKGVDASLMAYVLHSPPSITSIPPDRLDTNFLVLNLQPSHYGRFHRQ
jgi:hypothetical protein